MNVNKVQPFKYRLHFMRRICGRAGVKHFGFHAIRHITGSILYHLGYMVAVIQPIMSHKSPGTTERYLRSHGLAEMEGEKDSSSVRSLIIRVSDQLKAGEIKLIEVSEQESAAAKARLDEVRKKRRERHASKNTQYK